MLLAKRETSLQSVSDGITEIGRCNEMEMNVEKTKESEYHGNHPQYTLR